MDRKTSTTVAMDFGRITIDSEIILYLFGTPGQERFWFMWDDLVDGAIGAVVLLDTRRIEQCFAAVDYFESRGVPFVAVVNQFPDAGSYSLEEVREALALPRARAAGASRRPVTRVGEDGARRAARPPDPAGDRGRREHDRRRWSERQSSSTSAPRRAARVRCSTRAGRGRRPIRESEPRSS